MEATLSFASRRTFAIGASAAALAACTGGGSSREFVNVYSARRYDADRMLYAAFKNATGVAVRVLPAIAEQLLERMPGRGEATEADLVVAADAGNLWRIQDAGLLQPVTTPALEQGVPERLRDPARPLLGFHQARRHRLPWSAVQPEDIASYDDLANPRFRGQIVMRTRPTPISSRHWLSHRAPPRRGGARKRGPQACAPISRASRKAATPIRSKRSPLAKARRRW
ncbi:MAG: hypothetical protein R3C16_02520 [Hyphomonadaceae bacterium]